MSLGHPENVLETVKWKLIMAVEKKKNLKSILRTAAMPLTMAFDPYGPTVPWTGKIRTY